jgi:hypothetical protein
MGQAMAQGNSTVTTNGTTTITTQASNGYKQGIYNGLGQGAQTMGQFFQEQANLTKPLVRIAAGTPLGIFFVAPVMESTTGGTALQQNQGMGYNGNMPYGGANAGMGGVGANANYPGTASSGFGANAVPYPNYATPGSGYSSRSTFSGQSSPYAQQNYGQ